MALLWQLGHGVLCICLLSLPGAVAVWWVSRSDSDVSQGAALSVIAPVLLFASIGVVVKRYAVKKGAGSNANSG